MELTQTTIIYGIIAFMCAILLAFAITPLVRILSFKLGTIDVPKDNRRMHKKPVPLIGGLAIFLAFLITCLLLCDITKEMLVLLGGSLIMVIVGIIDDKKSINAWLKFLIQIAVAGGTVAMGIRIEQINWNGNYVTLGAWGIPLTMLWIVGLTNAINIIDGLDGLSCGVSTISCISILFVTVLQGGDASIALITLILIGSCLGFIPYNKNPAKMFMGDTGALFLGYALSFISIQGMLKRHMAISVIVPLLIFAFPIADTSFAIIRRVLSGKSPFQADRGHLHHRLVDMGFTQKKTVTILYSICGLLGMVAVFMCENMFAINNVIKSVAMIVIALAIFFIYMLLLKNPKHRSETGLMDEEPAAPKAPDADAAPVDEGKNDNEHK